MLQHESELEHMPMCVCTKNLLTGEVLDYDCGPQLDRLRKLESDVEHARAIAACAIGQPDRAEAVAHREEMEERLRRVRKICGLT